MTIECLGFINDKLNEIGINYEFERWSDDHIPSCYFVGEYTENESLNEDGLHESVFLLTGTTKGSWLELEKAKQKIEELFPSIFKETYSLSNGSRLAVFYDNAFPVPTDDMELKRIQINLNIKEWMVK